MISPASQIITWSNPAAIISGTALGIAQLDAVVSGVAGGSAPGALSYTPPAGTVLAAGAGQNLTVNAAATIESIERAVEAVHQGEARAVVTNPIAKATLYQAGFKHPGHTEYLGALAKAWDSPAFPVMMIWSETLAVVPVTIHIPLADAPKALTNQARTAVSSAASIA